MGEIIKYVVIAIISIFALSQIVSVFRIVPQQQEWVIERLGVYKTTWEKGVNFRIPFIDRIAAKVNLKEQTFDYEPQQVITDDNVTMLIDAVVYLRVMDSFNYTYQIQNAAFAIENLTSTTLRSVIGSMTMQECLSSREKINANMLQQLDEATDPWGIKVTRVEIKNITPPQDIREAMEKQLKAEKEKFAAITYAQGERESAILKAEGEKQAKILEAESKKQATILDAQGQREAQIAKAEGKAKEIELLYTAQAEGIKMIVAANPSDGFIKLKSLEALEKTTNNKGTTVIIPSEIQNMASILQSGKTILKANEENK